MKTKIKIDFIIPKVKQEYIWKNHKLEGIEQYLVR